MAEQIEPAAKETAEQPESRREALSAALDQAVSKDETTEPELKTASESANETESSSKDDKTAKSERVRDDKGKFVQKPPDSKTEEVKAEPLKTSRKYPSAWKKDHEPVYRKLEADNEYKVILDEIERRESEYHKGIEGYKPFANFGQKIQQVIRPYQQTLQQMGLQPEQAVQKLLDADARLRNATPEQRPLLLAQLARGYGIDPAALSSVPPIDPTIYALQTKIEQLERGTQTFLTSIQKQNETRANADVESFKKDKPYFEELRPKMRDLLIKGAAEELQDAYEMALAATPAIQEKVFAERQTKAEAERRQKERQKVAVAKSAAGQVKGAPAGSSQSRSLKDKDRRAMLEEAAGRLN